MVRKMRKTVDHVFCASHKPEIRNSFRTVEKLLRAKQGGKIYSIHEPSVHLICKRTIRNPDEYGRKDSVAISFKDCFNIGKKSILGAQYDGRTLTPALQKLRILKAYHERKCMLMRDKKDTSTNVFVSRESSE